MSSFAVDVVVTLAVALICFAIGVGVGRATAPRKPKSPSEIPFDLPHKDHSDRKF